MSAKFFFPIIPCIRFFPFFSRCFQTLFLPKRSSSLLLIFPVYSFFSKCSLDLPFPQSFLSFRSLSGFPHFWFPVLQSSFLLSFKSSTLLSFHFSGFTFFLFLPLNSLSSFSHLPVISISAILFFTYPFFLL